MTHAPIRPALPVLALFIAAIAAMSVTSCTATAQNRLTPRTLEGEWKLRIEVSDEIRREAESETNPFASAVMDGVAGMLSSLFDNLDIRFTFHRDGSATLKVHSGSEYDAPEVETLYWSIDSDNRLVLEDRENPSVDLSFDNRWILRDGRLHATEDDGTLKESVYLERVREAI